MGMLSRLNPLRSKSQKEGSAEDSGNEGSQKSKRRNWFGWGRKTSSREQSEVEEESEEEEEDAPPPPPPPKKVDKRKLAKSASARDTQQQAQAPPPPPQQQQQQQQQYYRDAAGAQAQELAELKQRLSKQEQATHVWEERYNMQQFKLNLMVDMLVLKVLESERSSPAGKIKARHAHLNASVRSDRSASIRSFSRSMQRQRQPPPRNDAPEMIESYDDDYDN